MEYKTYYRKLKKSERAAYALRARTTVNYIDIHLISTPPRKTPKRALMERLAEATEGNCSLTDVLDHFYGTSTA